MNYTIKNEQLTVTISSRGAELQSLRTADGTEYLWQGDPAYWTSHAPNIFPYVARLTEGKYSLHGPEYGFGNHGLVRYEDLVADNISDRSITFCLDANEETERKYPFDFRYRIRYKLTGCRLVIQTAVENWGDETMYFAVGGHPGFNVPLDEGLDFSDYYLEFNEEAHPYRIFLADSGAVTPKQGVYELSGRRIPLHHDLFDHDAVVLQHASRKVTLASERGSRSVTIAYPGFRYIGFWHKPKTDAPYICIEPWTSLPSREGIIENLALQGDLISLPGGEKWSTEWWIGIR